MGFFNKKTPENKIEEKQCNDVDIVSVNERPRVCCIDIEDEVQKKLKDQGFNIYSGSLGNKIAVPNSRRNENHQVLLHFDFPANLHEYDIVVIDLDHCKTVDYKSEEHIRDRHTGKSAISLLSTFPETVFNPRPLSSLLLKNSLQEIGHRAHMIIVFSTGDYSVEYESIKIHEDYVERQRIQKYSIYSFSNDIQLSDPKFGKELVSCNIREDLKNLLDSQLPKTKYNQTFYHPTKWENGKNVPKDSWFPLLKNANNEIVSICNSTPKSISFYFPQFENKQIFLNEFLTKIAPEIMPELFPFSTTFSWTDHNDYWLPNHSNLLDERRLVDEEYKNKISEIDKNINANKEKYSFLHNILTKTGDELKDALIVYFELLECKNIVDCDSKEKDLNIKEEDIQIDVDDGLLIIECKGIGGTSTDSDCSQISKIKHRRCKERNKFDVSALYIVNHQRYLPPLIRTNPPFNQKQIQDAQNDERGLLSTWQMYNLYFDIENGVISKSEARDSLLRHGLVDFKPTNLIFVDEPNEIFKEGSVCIINVENIELNIGDELIVERNSQYNKAIINGIQINDKPVSSADSGEIGLLINPPIKKKSKLWIRKSS